MSPVEQQTKKRCFPLFPAAYDANVSKVSSWIVLVLSTFRQEANLITDVVAHSKLLNHLFIWAKNILSGGKKQACKS